MTVEIYNVRTARVGKSYPKDALSPVTIPAPWHDRDSAMLGNSLTPTLLTQLIFSRNIGDLQGWVDLANEARRKDPHMHSQLAIREQSVVETEFTVLPGKDAQRRGSIKAAKKAVSACQELLESWQSRPDQGWERWLAEIVAASFYGRTAHETLWDRVEGETRPLALAKVNERRLSYACELYDPNPWALRLWDRDDPLSPFGGSYGVPLSDFHPDKFIVHEPRVAGGNQAEEGLFAVIVWYWLFRTWSWRDLMALAEMLGRPPVIGYYAAGGARQGRDNQLNGTRNATDPEISAANRTVKGLTGALRSVLPDTIRIEPLNFTLPTTDPLQLLTSREIDGLQSKAINGVANLSDLKAGARAAVESQERVSFTFWRADCRGITRLINTLFARYIRANPDRFGESCPLPILKAQTDPPKDRVAVLDAVDKAQRVGMRIPRQWVHDETGIPVPEADAKTEDILKPAAPTAPAAAAPSDPSAPPDQTPPTTPAAKE